MAGEMTREERNAILLRHSVTHPHGLSLDGWAVARALLALESQLARVTAERDEAREERAFAVDVVRRLSACESAYGFGSFGTRCLTWWVNGGRTKRSGPLCNGATDEQLHETAHEPGNAGMCTTCAALFRARIVLGQAGRKTWAEHRAALKEREAKRLRAALEMEGA